MVYHRKFFWRRGFAFLTDLLIVAILVTLIAVAARTLTGWNVTAPTVFKHSQCTSEEMLSVERMRELLPLDGFQTHQQFICSVSYMFVTTQRTLLLRRIEKTDSGTQILHLSFPIDSMGNFSKTYPSDIILYFLFPFLSGLCIAAKGKTPGKKLFTLGVATIDGNRSDLKTSLKREYLKSAPFIAFGFIQLYFIIAINDAGPEVLGRQLVRTAESGLNWLWFALTLCSALAFVWYLFGSFLRWKGQTYWDRQVGTVVDDLGNLIESSKLKAS